MSRAEAEASISGVEMHVLDISFDQIKDPADRDYFLNLPTSFVLPDEAVDRLRDKAGELFRQSDQYSTILNSFGEEMVDQ